MLLPSVAVMKSDAALCERISYLTFIGSFLLIKCMFRAGSGFLSDI